MKDVREEIHVIYGSGLWSVAEESEKRRHLTGEKPKTLTVQM